MGQKQQLLPFESKHKDIYTFNKPILMWKYFEST